MDASVLGTGSLVLNKAMSALNLTRSGANTVPGYSNGGFITQNGLGRIDASIFSLRFNLALPTGAPADFPMALIYNSAIGRFHRVWKQLVSAIPSVRGKRLAAQSPHTNWDSPLYEHKWNEHLRRLAE